MSESQTIVYNCKKVDIESDTKKLIIWHEKKIYPAGKKSVYVNYINQISIEINKTKLNWKKKSFLFQSIDKFLFYFSGFYPC